MDRRLSQVKASFCEQMSQDDTEMLQTPSAYTKATSMNLRGQITRNNGPQPHRACGSQMDQKRREFPEDLEALLFVQSLKDQAQALSHNASNSRVKEPGSIVTTEAKRNSDLMHNYPPGRSLHIDIYQNGKQFQEKHPSCENNENNFELYPPESKPTENEVQEFGSPANEKNALSEGTNQDLFQSNQTGRQLMKTIYERSMVSPGDPRYAMLQKKQGPTKHVLLHDVKQTKFQSKLLLLRNSQLKKRGEILEQKYLRHISELNMSVDAALGQTDASLDILTFKDVFPKMAPQDKRSSHGLKKGRPKKSLVSPKALNKKLKSGKAPFFNVRGFSRDQGEKTSDKQLVEKLLNSATQPIPDALNSSNIGSSIGGVIQNAIELDMFSDDLSKEPLAPEKNFCTYELDPEPSNPEKPETFESQGKAASLVPEDKSKVSPERTIANLNNIYTVQHSQDTDKPISLRHQEPSDLMVGHQDLRMGRAMVNTQRNEDNQIASQIQRSADSNLLTSEGRFGSNRFHDLSQHQDSILNQKMEFVKVLNNNPEQLPHHPQTRTEIPLRESKSVVKGNQPRQIGFKESRDFSANSGKSQQKYKLLPVTDYQEITVKKKKKVSKPRALIPEKPESLRPYSQSDQVVHMSQSILNLINSKHAKDSEGRDSESQVLLGPALYPTPLQLNLAQNNLAQNNIDLMVQFTGQLMAEINQEAQAAQFEQKRVKTAPHNNPRVLNRRNQQVASQDQVQRPRQPKSLVNASIGNGGKKTEFFKSRNGMLNSSPNVKQRGEVKTRVVSNLGGGNIISPGAKKSQKSNKPQRKSRRQQSQGFDLSSLKLQEECLPQTSSGIPSPKAETYFEHSVINIGEQNLPPRPRTNQNPFARPRALLEMPEVDSVTHKQFSKDLISEEKQSNEKVMTQLMTRFSSKADSKTPGFSKLSPKYSPLSFAQAPFFHVQPFGKTLPKDKGMQNVRRFLKNQKAAQTKSFGERSFDVQRVEQIVEKNNMKARNLRKSWDVSCQYSNQQTVNQKILTFQGPDSSKMPAYFQLNILQRNKAALSQKSNQLQVKDVPGFSRPVERTRDSLGHNTLMEDLSSMNLLDQDQEPQNKASTPNYFSQSHESQAIMRPKNLTSEKNSDKSEMKIDNSSQRDNRIVTGSGLDHSQLKESGEYGFTRSFFKINQGQPLPRIFQNGDNQFGLEIKIPASPQRGPVVESKLMNSVGENPPHIVIIQATEQEVEKLRLQTNSSTHIIDSHQVKSRADSSPFRVANFVQDSRFSPEQDLTSFDNLNQPQVMSADKSMALQERKLQGSAHKTDLDVSKFLTKTNEAALSFDENLQEVSEQVVSQHLHSNLSGGIKSKSSLQQVFARSGNLTKTHFMSSDPHNDLNVSQNSSKMSQNPESKYSPRPKQKFVKKEIEGPSLTRPVLEKSTGIANQKGKIVVNVQQNQTHKESKLLRSVLEGSPGKNYIQMKSVRDIESVRNQALEATGHDIAEVLILDFQNGLKVSQVPVKNLGRDNFSETCMVLSQKPGELNSSSAVRQEELVKNIVGIYRNQKQSKTDEVEDTNSKVQIGLKSFDFPGQQQPAPFNPGNRIVFQKGCSRPNTSSDQRQAFPSQKPRRPHLKSRATKRSLNSRTIEGTIQSQNTNLTIRKQEQNRRINLESPTSNFDLDLRQALSIESAEEAIHKMEVQLQEMGLPFKMALEPHFQNDTGPTNPTAQPQHSPVLFPSVPQNEGLSEINSSLVAKSNNNSIISRASVAGRAKTQVGHSAPDEAQLMPEARQVSGGLREEGRVSRDTNQRSFQVDYRHRFEHGTSNRLDVGKLDNPEVRQSSIGEKQSSALRSESRSSQIKITDSILGPKVRTRTFKKLNIKSASVMAGDSLDWEHVRQNSKRQQSDHLDSYGKGSISTQNNGSVNRTQSHRNLVSTKRELESNPKISTNEYNTRGTQEIYRTEDSRGAEVFDLQ